MKFLKLSVLLQLIKGKLSFLWISCMSFFRKQYIKMVERFIVFLTNTLDKTMQHLVVLRGKDANSMLLSDTFSDQIPKPLFERKGFKIAFEGVRPFKNQINWVNNPKNHPITRSILKDDPLLAEYKEKLQKEAEKNAEAKDEM
jgi:hypothetical protein